MSAIFESIRESLKKQESKSSYDDILRTTPGNTYTVRLLPYVEEPANTFYHYFMQGWNSFATGNYVQVMSPTTYGERDPISETRFSLAKIGTNDQQEKAKTLRRAEKWMVNVLVVDDPENPENNGKVKILRFGKQLAKIIFDAIDGEGSDEFGDSIFELGKAGVDLKIKVDKQADFPNYSSSRFSTKSTLKLSSEEQQSVLDKLHKLDEVIPRKTSDEINEMLNEHFHVAGSNTSSVKKSEATSSKSDEVEDLDDIDGASDADVEDLLRGIV
jgi:hypothetical protein